MLLYHIPNEYQVMEESAFSLLECRRGILSVAFVKSGGGETPLVKEDTRHAEH
jgi:hypothetical protein